jgi:predicted nucleic acid-binding protein
MSIMTVIDTDILIDAGRGIEAASRYLTELENSRSLAISAVTQMELIVGCRNKRELQNLDRFLNRFRVLRISPRISDQAVSFLRTYRLSHGLLIADALIAATAVTFDFPLASKNQKDYRFIEALDLLPYPSE